MCLGIRSEERIEVSNVTSWALLCKVCSCSMSRDYSLGMTSYGSAFHFVSRGTELTSRRRAASCRLRSVSPGGVRSSRVYRRISGLGSRQPTPLAAIGRYAGPVYDREKKAAFERAGLSKLCNVLRHSFCSYHFALHQDAAKTALLMQHTNQAMLYRHYKGLALRSDAEKYFMIRP